MAEDPKEVKEDGPKKDDPKDPPLIGLLKVAGEKLVPVLVTAGSLLGFVAFAGGIAVWTRFSAAKVPADQAVNVIPRDELVSTGSSLLLLFGFFAALALVAVFLIDRGGRATPGMSRGLLLILMAEGAAIILLVDPSFPLAQRVAATELFVLFVGIALWATYVGWFAELENDLRKRKNEVLDPEVEKDSTFRLAGGGSAVAVESVILSFFLALLAGAVAAVIAGLAWRWSAWVVAIGLGAVGVVLLIILVVLWMRSDLEKNSDAGRGTTEQVKGEEQTKGEEQAEDPVPGEEKAPKPRRLELTRRGEVLVTAAISLAAVGSFLILEDWWVGASLATAAVLAAGLWRTAYLAEGKFVWYGLAVFISVPLLGTLTGLVHNLADPQVQPMALIRETDGPDEAIQGLYVTETSDRVYFSNVGMEGCESTVSDHSGRLLWVPKSEVVAMSIGPLQSIPEAEESALEMSYALTPAVETPAGSHVSLTVAEERSKGSEAQREASELKQRLESAGPAVRPTFGSGLRLVPEVASPGDEVTLRMSTPRRDVEGFGSARAGKTLRLDGVPVQIVREAAARASEAEYAKTLSGVRLPLDRESVPDDVLGGYVTLAEGAADAVDDHDGTTNELSLRLDGAGLASGPDGEPPTVTLPGDDPIGLATGLLRQAWHEDEIKFRVPPNGASGVVTVECGQLAGQPLLRVAHAPRARIAVQMQANSSRVLFDSQRSADDGEIVDRSWAIEGAPESHGMRTSVDLPPRLGAYSVRLAVTDDDKKTDTAELRLLRLPASSFGFDKDQPLHSRDIEHARQALQEAVEAAAPASVEVDGHADDVGTSAYNLSLSFARARNVREALLAARPATGKAAVDEQMVPVTTLAYGETCPADERSGRRPRNRRVDVFVLGQDVSVVPAHGCHPGRTESTAWPLASQAPAR